MLGSNKDINRIFNILPPTQGVEIEDYLISPKKHTRQTFKHIILLHVYVLSYTFLG